MNAIDPFQGDFIMEFKKEKNIANKSEFATGIFSDGYFKKLKLRTKFTLKYGARFYFHGDNVRIFSLIRF